MVCKEKATVFWALGIGVGEENMLLEQQGENNMPRRALPPILHTTLSRGDITNYRIQAKLSYEREQAR